LCSTASLLTAVKRPSRLTWAAQPVGSVRSRNRSGRSIKCWSKLTSRGQGLARLNKRSFLHLGCRIGVDPTVVPEFRAD
jgi:hypothetical protein